MPSPDTKTFLKLIKALESDNNPNAVHRTIASDGGIQAGDSAVGEAALMPNTAKEMANRAIQSGTGDINDTLIRDASNQDVHGMLQGNPDLRNRYVNNLAGSVMDKTNNNPELAATAWLYGHNLSNSNLNDKLQNDPDYQNRINSKINELHLQSDKPTFDIPQLEDTLDDLNQPKVYPFSKLRKSLN